MKLTQIINFLILSFFLLLISCKDRQVDHSSSTSISFEHPTSSVTKDGSENDLWMKHLNAKSEDFKNLYTEEAIKVLEDGEVLEGDEEIKNHFFSNRIKVLSISSDTILVANTKRGLSYEIGTYTNQNGNNYKSVIIWQARNDSHQRVFEFTAEYETSEIDLSELNARRDEWMTICNSHDAARLVKELYSVNTLYYNHKPLVSGHDLLVKEYDYMNNENYQLTLNPIIIESVSKNLVFEMGQCEGSYNGKYILIWSKNTDGVWEVFIDSNI